ncbi:TRAP transporter small permease [Halorhodospira halophila]|uniref:TRAP transporter small permease n=1 Tax=Halorhodospira halophila TaxID=1053 RepID=UPI00191320FB|nr:TRAP transporter small permease [Halorhodospira halophila]MBK5937464.1 hypothetical protein [Halorhodospira halophila]
MGTRKRTWLERLDGGIARFEAFLLAGGVLLLAGLSIANTLSRNLTGNTVPGTFELTEILMIWITFGGLAYGVRRARHICMNAVYDQLRGLARKGLLVFTHVGTAGLLFYMAWHAGHYVWEVHQGGRTSTALGIPMGLAYSIVPVGLFAGGVQYALSAWKNLTRRAIYRSYSEREAYESGEDPAGDARL